MLRPITLTSSLLLACVACASQAGTSERASDNADATPPPVDHDQAPAVAQLASVESRPPNGPASPQEPDAGVVHAPGTPLTGLLGPRTGEQPEGVAGLFGTHGSGTKSGGGLGSLARLGKAVPRDGGPVLLPATGSMAQVRYGAFTVTGCDAGRVRPTLDRFLGGFRFCYDQQLQSNRDLAGGLTLSVQIAADGSVETATVTDSTLSNVEVEVCVARVARSLQFPAADATCSLSVPLSFAAR